MDDAISDATQLIEGEWKKRVAALESPLPAPREGISALTQHTWETRKKGESLPPQFENMIVAISYLSLTPDEGLSFPPDAQKELESTDLGRRLVAARQKIVAGYNT